MNSFRLVNAKCNYPLLCINSAWCFLQIRRHIRPHFQQSDSMRVLYEVITFVGKTLAFGYMAFPFTMLDFWPPIKIYRYKLLFSFAFCFHWIIHCAPIYVFRGWFCTIVQSYQCKCVLRFFCSEMYFWLHIAALAIIVHFRFIHPIFSKSRERGKVVTTQTPVNVSADGDKKDR